MKERKKNGQKKKQKCHFESENAITLIALVISIIVMMILARSELKCYSGREWNYNTGAGGKKCL